LEGCGYRPIGALSSPPSLALAPLTNSTLKPGIQATLSSAIARELRRDPAVKLVPFEIADTLLEGTIAAYTNDGIGFDQLDIARRFRLRIVLDLALKDRQSGTVLRKGELFGEAFYTAGASAVASQAAEEEAATRAAMDLAERVRFWITTGL
jgi:hypothetical protein